MADIGASNWTEADASNTTAAPDGWPEGMAPSGVNDSGRAMQGAIKRFYDWQSVKATAGTSTAYTLTYTVAPGALVDGMCHVVQFNAANGAAATLNVNGLGAKPLYMYLGVSGTGAAWAAAPAGGINANDVADVFYNTSAGAYFVMIRPGAPLVFISAPSAAATVDFTSIPSTVNDLEITFNLTPSTNGANLLMRLYNSGGSPDTGAHYAWILNTTSTSSTTLPQGATASTSFALATGVSSVAGLTGKITLPAIQLSLSGYSGTLSYGDSGGTLTGTNYVGGQTSAAGPITGVRFLASAGNLTGRVTVRGYV